MSAKSRWQLLPPLSDAEYAELEASIKEKGILMPILEDMDTGEILDGHHRKEIADKLGLTEYPVDQRLFKNDTERIKAVLDLNLARRHLDAETRSRLRAEYAKARGVKRGSAAPKGNQRAAKKTDRHDVALNSDQPTEAKVAAELGVSERTLQRDLAKADEREGKVKTQKPETVLITPVNEAATKVLHDVGGKFSRALASNIEQLRRFRVQYPDADWSQLVPYLKQAQGDIDQMIQRLGQPLTQEESDKVRSVQEAERSLNKRQRGKRS